MAKWKVTYNSLKENGRDEVKWPIIESITDNIIIDDDKIARVYFKAKEIIIASVPYEILSLCIVDIERIDKETDIEYFTQNESDILSFALGEDDSRRLHSIQMEILRTGEIHSFNGFKLLTHYYPGLVVQEIDNKESAFATMFNGFLNHENAKTCISSLNKFYSRVKPEHIKILNIDSRKVSLDESELIVSYLKGKFPFNSDAQNDFLKDSFDLLKSKVNDPKEIVSLISWIVEREEIPSLVSNLRKLTADNLNKLNSFIGVANLKNCLTRWDENRNNSSEDYWQKEFGENSYLISQLFASPFIILEGQAYVGGKGIDNKGGLLVDFLFSNKLSKNLCIVELKTPTTKLLGAKYREGIYAISSEVSGAIAQLCNYKDSLLKSYLSIHSTSSSTFNVYDPRCILIAGDLSVELNDPERIKSFELFRQQLGNIQLITYDELFERMKILVDLIDGGFSA